MPEGVIGGGRKDFQMPIGVQGRRRGAVDNAPNGGPGTPVGAGGIRLVLIAMHDDAIEMGRKGVQVAIGPQDHTHGAVAEEGPTAKRVPATPVVAAGDVDHILIVNVDLVIAGVRKDF